MNTKLNQHMLKTMQQPEIKEAGLKIKMVLKDGSKRMGIYQDIVYDPVNNPDLKDVPFVKIIASRPEKGLIMYVPSTLVESVEWSEGDLNYEQ